MTSKMGAWTRRLGYSLLLGILLITIANCEDLAESEEKIIEKEIDSLSDATKHRGLYKLGKIVEIVTGVRVNDFNGSETDFGKDSLWRGLYQQCSKRPTMACVKSNVFGFLDHSLGLDGDFQLTDGLVFTRNKFVENKYDRKLNEIDPDEGVKVKPIPISADWMAKGDTGSDARDGRSFASESGSARDISTFEGLSDTLYDRTMRFLQGHDLQMQLPAMFGGAVVRVSPKALEGEGGALVQLEMTPKTKAEVEPRLFGKIKEKVKKKLVLAFLALILVVKMIKLKLFFFLPMIIGAGAAKQFLLKVLLFLFPAFAHLFKICSVYQGIHGHHGGHGKLHHHHHKIAHHHHHIRVPVPVPVHTGTHHTPHSEYGVPEQYGGQTLGEDHGFQSHGAEHPFAGSSSFPGGSSTFSGGSSSFPGASPSFSGSSSFAGGSSTFPGGSPTFAGGTPFGGASQFSGGPPYAGGSYAGSVGSEYSHHRSDMLTRHALQHENELASWGLGANSNNKEVSSYFPQPQAIYPGQKGAPPAQTSANQSPLRYNTIQNAQSQQGSSNIRVQVLTPAPAPASVAAPAAKYDAFYSPILQRMDQVFAQLGFNEEACRDRLVCSMYKNPQRFSPHSNLISAELSRDSQELQKPSVSNSAVTRFHRYVEAARKGQDRGDCLRLYPTCAVNTE